MLRMLSLALLLLAAAAPAAGGATRSVDLPELFATQLERAHAQTEVPILLPQTMRADFRRFFAEGRATADAWRFDLAAARDCNQANVCFVAEFKAVRDGRPSGRRTIRLNRGRTGYYHRGTCRAYCTPPSIEWRERHALYSIQAKVTKRELVRMVNSAIRNGPR